MTPEIELGSLMRENPTVLLGIWLIGAMMTATDWGMLRFMGAAMMSYPGVMAYRALAGIP